MRLTHADIVDPSFSLQKNRTLIIEEGRIVSVHESSVSESSSDENLDLSGMILIPGFIDLHIHGALGADTSDGEVEGLKKISLYLAEKGVTSFCPTTMSRRW